MKINKAPSAVVGVKTWSLVSKLVIGIRFRVYIKPYVCNGILFKVINQFY